MFGSSQMKRSPHKAGLGSAIAILVACAIWLVLTLVHPFLPSQTHLPVWEGIVVGVGILATPPLFTFGESFHWIVRLSFVGIFLVFTAVFSLFYRELHIFYCVIILLLYVESFAVIPLLLKRRKRRVSQRELTN